MLNSGSRGWKWMRAGLCLGLALVLFNQVEAAPKESLVAPSPVASPPPPEWIRSEMVFSLQRPDGAGLSPGEWEQFVTEVIVPRFPDRWTMMEGFGKAKGAAAASERDPVNILVLVHPNNSRLSAALNEVASEYKKRFQLSVILVNTPAEVAFY